jgi:hypothetical protein
MKKIGLYIILASELTSCGQRLSNDSLIHEGVEIKADSTLGSVTYIGRMTTARSAHSATLLKNGTVLICGGFTGASLASAEVYNSELKTFKPVGQMRFARSGHSATLLPDGKVLIAGGYNGNYLSSTEVFDPEKETFSIGPLLNVPRSGHTATTLKGGEVLLAGGISTGWAFLQSAELYDVEKATFAPIGSMKVARESHTATLLKNGNVLITGGHEGRRPNIKIHPSAEIYSINSKTFSVTGSMSLKRHKHDAVLLSNGMVLVTGGSDERDSRGVYNDTELYDPASSSFQSSAHMNFRRYKHYSTSILLSNGYVLITGGANKAEVYSTRYAKFTPIPGDLELQMLFSCATLLSNGNVLITGGYDKNQKISSGSWVFSSSQ